MSDNQLFRLAEINVPFKKRNNIEIRSDRFYGCQSASSSFAQHSASTTSISNIYSANLWRWHGWRGLPMYYVVFGNGRLGRTSILAWRFHRVYLYWYHPRISCHCFPTVEIILNDHFSSYYFSSYLLARFMIYGANSFEFQNSKLSTG